MGFFKREKLQIKRFGEAPEKKKSKEEIPVKEKELYLKRIKEVGSNLRENDLIAFKMEASVKAHCQYSDIKKELETKYGEIPKELKKAAEDKFDELVKKQASVEEIKALSDFKNADKEKLEKMNPLDREKMELEIKADKIFEMQKKINETIEKAKNPGERISLKELQADIDKAKQKLREKYINIQEKKTGIQQKKGHEETESYRKQIKDIIEDIEK